MRLPKDNLLNKEIERQNELLAKVEANPNLDSNEMLRVLEKIIALFAASLGVTNRFEQHELKQKADRENKDLVESHKNIKANALGSASGALGAVGSGALFATFVGAALLGGIPFQGLEKLFSIANGVLTLSTQGLSGLSNAAQGGDRAKQQEMEHLLKYTQTEGNDKQTASQTYANQAVEAARRGKEHQDAQNNAWSAAFNAAK